MSIANGMIKPFSENQVRLDSDGNKLISYGVSSFGYDVRCSNEFKVFTNINSAVVDPKNFDANSFVDVKSDVCVIPHGHYIRSTTFKAPAPHRVCCGSAIRTVIGAGHAPILTCHYSCRRLMEHPASRVHGGGYPKTAVRCICDG